MLKVLGKSVRETCWILQAPGAGFLPLLSAAMRYLELPPCGHPPRPNEQESCFLLPRQVPPFPG